MTRVLPAEPQHAEDWQRLRLALWPDATIADLRRDIEQYFAGECRNLEAVLLAQDASGQIIGFAELNIRLYAEGCDSDRVAFLEGWYVEPAFRGQGVGAMLITAAEQWAVANGCTEFASDTLYENAVGRAAHLAVGFEEVEAIRCFRKQVTRGD